MANPSATSKQITIQDVAAAAGVSTQTVSRVINAKPDIAEVTRECVMEAVRQLGYRPNSVARSLVSSRTHTLGVIASPLGDPFRAEVVRSAEREARQRGYVCIITFGDGTSETVRRMCHLLEERQVDGLLLLTPGSVPHDTIDIRLPAVALAFPVLNGMVTNVDVDNVDGGYQAAAHLTDLGHRRICVVVGPDGWKASADRTEGARRALAAVGVSLDPSRIEVAEDWTLDAGYTAASALMERHPDTTALFCQNDLLAIGALRLLRERGRSVPGDVSVIGYDDMPICLYTSPSLSTVRQPRETLGRLLVQLLVDAIEQQTHSGQDVQVRAEVMPRESTAAPPCR